MESSNCSLVLAYLSSSEWAAVEVARNAGARPSPKQFLHPSVGHLYARLVSRGMGSRLVVADVLSAQTNPFGPDDRLARSMFGSGGSGPQSLEQQMLKCSHSNWRKTWTEAKRSEWQEIEGTTKELRHMQYGGDGAHLPNISNDLPDDQIVFGMLKCLKVLRFLVGTWPDDGNYRTDCTEWVGRGRGGRMLGTIDLSAVYQVRSRELGSQKSKTVCKVLSEVIALVDGEQWEYPPTWRIIKIRCEATLAELQAARGENPELFVDSEGSGNED